MMRPTPYQDNQSNPLVQYVGFLMTCVPLQIMDLTGRTDAGNAGKTQLLNKISSINPINHSYTIDTFIPAGLLWGWNMLTSVQPLDRGVSKATQKELGLKKVLVLMTDGINNRMVDASGISLYSVSDPTLPNKLTSDLCSNIKNDDIIIYTVNFAVSDATTEALLKSCASDPAFYYKASNADQISAAFDQIGRSLRPVRLLK